MIEMEVETFFKYIEYEVRIYFLKGIFLEKESKLVTKYSKGTELLT